MAISELEVNKIIPQDFKGKDFLFIFIQLRMEVDSMVELGFIETDSIKYHQVIIMQ